MSVAFVAVAGCWADTGPVHSGTECAMQVRVFSRDASFDDPADFRAGAVYLFSGVSTDTMAAALEGVEPGKARKADALFISDDTRWRLLRPLPAENAPDSLEIAPAQTQYLVQPVPGAVYTELVLVGLPGEDGKVVQPALAGVLGDAAGRQAGQLFTIEPDQPEACVVDPDAVALQTQTRLVEHLKQKD